MKTALLLVDLQNDFCPGGALAVSEGDSVIDIANQAMIAAAQRREPIIASQDWHPANHKSFAVNSGKTVGTQGVLNGLAQIWWPIHCVQGSVGADFHPLLNTSAISVTIKKGQHPEIDSYSAFFDNGHQQETELNAYLKSQHIEQIVIMGLATDYCVKYTILDALQLGYHVQVIAEGCRGVNLSPDDSQAALAEIEQAGAKIVTLSQYVQH